jgi:hypothetical protein
MAHGVHMRHVLSNHLYNTARTTGRVLGTAARIGYKTGKVLAPLGVAAARVLLMPESHSRINDSLRAYDTIRNAVVQSRR